MNPPFCAKEFQTPMILAPSTLETIHAITGEEPMPESPFLRRVVSLIYAVDPTIWARRVDLCLVGGDPMVIAARLRRLCERRELDPHQRVAIVDPGLFSGAPMAALRDPAVLEEFVSAGAISMSSAAPMGQWRDPADIVSDMVTDAALRLASGGPQIIHAVEQVQGARDHVRGEIVLRLTRDRARRRHGAQQRVPASRGVEIVSAGQHSAELFEASHRLSDAGSSLLRRALAPITTCPPRGARFADVLVAHRVEVLSGFISPGQMPSAVRFDESFMEREIGAEVFRLARRVPTSLEDALSAWREDLLRAARGGSPDH